MGVSATGRKSELHLRLIEMFDKDNEKRETEIEDTNEKEDKFEVTVDLPGLKPEEVEVEFKGDSLWITGERKEEKEKKDKTYHRVERSYGEFRRVLPLPSAVSRLLGPPWGGGLVNKGPP